jgi:hypothetical protein
MQTIGAWLCFLGLTVMALGPTIGSRIALLVGATIFAVGVVVSVFTPESPKQ